MAVKRFSVYNMNFEFNVISLSIINATICADGTGMIGRIAFAYFHG